MPPAPGRRANSTAPAPAAIRVATAPADQCGAPGRLAPLAAGPPSAWSLRPLADPYRAQIRCMPASSTASDRRTRRRPDHPHSHCATHSRPRERPRAPAGATLKRCPGTELTPAPSAVELPRLSSVQPGQLCARRRPETAPRPPPGRARPARPPTAQPAAATRARAGRPAESSSSSSTWSTPAPASQLGDVSSPGLPQHLLPTFVPTLHPLPIFVRFQPPSFLGSPLAGKSAGSYGT